MSFSNEEVVSTSTTLIDLIEDGGIKKKILAVAPHGSKGPIDGQECVVHYRGYLQNGKEFDSSYGRQTPFTFELGAGQVIKGWDIGVASMKKGEKAQFVLQPSWAYGESGAPGIDPNSILNVNP